MKKILIFMILLFFSVAGTAYASTVATGVTVKAIGDSTTVGITEIKDGKTWIKYFIPLSGAASGDYGVKGLVADTGNGYGTGSGEGPALTMFIEYSPVEFPAATAVLTFEFLDLDIEPDNDPTDPDFFETIQIFSGNNNPLNQLTDVIYNAWSDDINPFYNVVSVGNLVTITFPDLTAYLGGNPTYAKLTFTSDYGNNSGMNTPEYLYTTLETTPVPIPGAVWLLGSGLLGLAGLRRKLRG
jgi:hypothetical protein